jgi:hypothetical protein
MLHPAWSLIMLLLLLLLLLKTPAHGSQLLQLIMTCYLFFHYHWNMLQMPERIPNPNSVLDQRLVGCRKHNQAVHSLLQLMQPKPWSAPERHEAPLASVCHCLWTSQLPIAEAPVA